MTDRTTTRPDLTLTLDEDGVIQKIVTAEALAHEQLDHWRGRRLNDTIFRTIDSPAPGKIEDMWLRGDSSCFEVRQRFPSGLELPMEYTTFSLGEKAGSVAIGRNLEAISELRARLQHAQEAHERDYWKMREIETRYRTLFDATTEAVALVNVGDHCVIEANFRANRDLYLTPGDPFLPQLPERDRRALDELFAKTREQGRAPGIVVQPTPSSGLWSMRASLMNAETGPVFICQLTQMRDAREQARDQKGFSIASFIERLTEGFVVIDREGVVRSANGAFLDLVQLAAESAVTERKLTRWLSSPGADANVLMSLIRKNGDLRRFHTRIDGELGQSVPVEITAVGDEAEQPNYFGLLVRDARSRARQAESPDNGLKMAEFDDCTLEEIVRMSTEVIERKAILQALDRCRDNRTAAARQLGLSRQSLHAKLKKYGLERK